MIPTTPAGVRLLTETYLLALTVWREARGESDEARAAVASCVLNRAARPSWWGKTVDEVLAKRWQFSSLTDPKDPQLTRWPLAADPSWYECVDIARRCLAGELASPVPGADSYFDTSIAPPAWTKSAAFIAQIGPIRFYDVDHDHEAPALVAAAEAGAGVSPEFEAKLKAFLS